MVNLLKEKLQQLWGRMLTGPVGQFFRWWAGELRQALPPAWQKKLQRAFRRVTLRLGQETLVIGVDENRRQSELQTFPISQDVPLQSQQLADLLEENALTEAPRFLLLDKATLLCKQITLPLAAESNLLQVLTFEMDRQTPFKASGVYFDWRIIERGTPAGQLRLELFVVPRAEVDAPVRLASDRGFTLAGVDVVENDTTQGLNLLPPAQRVRTANTKARLNVALGALAVLLLGVVMAQSLYLRAHQVSELEDAIAQVQGEARKVMRIKEEIKDTSEAAGFLARRRAGSPLAIELLADVTQILPDDTYLDRLVIGRESVQLQGKSQNAQRLIELVNESELMDDASFRGSTRLDARSGLEIFEVNASVSAPGGE